jgi:hypothetical protein
MENKNVLDAKRILDEIKPERIVSIDYRIEPFLERTVVIKYFVSEKEEKERHFPNLNCRCGVVEKWTLTTSTPAGHRFTKGKYVLEIDDKNDCVSTNTGLYICIRPSSTKALTWADEKIREHEEVQKPLSIKHTPRAICRHCGWEIYLQRDAIWYHLRSTSVYCSDEPDLGGFPRSLKATPEQKQTPEPLGSDW